MHVQQMLNKYSPDSKAHLRLATGGFQGEVFLKIISGEPRQRAWEEVREARREVAYIFSLFITCNFDGVFCSVKAILSFHFVSAENITYMLTRSKISHARSILISFNISIAMYRSCSLFSEGHCYHILILSCPTR